jgi:hypothetical protein
MTKKKRNSSRARSAARKGSRHGSTHGTATWTTPTKPEEQPVPLNRPAFRAAFAQVKGWYGESVRQAALSKRKKAQKTKRREIAKIRKETKRAMAAANPK